jgi:ferritin-like metal-binding protein YciE
MRPYNRKTDRYYSPDDTVELYLTEEQINEALESLPQTDNSAELSVRKTIKKIETINRNEKLGKISSSESTVKIRNISNDFLNEYGFWPYITKSFELFYKSFER